ncbi:assimilatory sulfite reductase (NADPH) flavoprotein subunit [Thermophagus sp. OGC60D27]|uniref:assimilatory sulfite reductase (NADPH) flavoprotein subunit n=1 Tax=Thermophagus sp. OGC60D27 TaxID=3458415 RepID=UPI004037CEAE
MTLNSLPLKETQQRALEELTRGLSADQALWLSGYFMGFHHQKTEVTPGKPSSQCDSAANDMPLTILYGTHTGRSESIARSLHEKASQRGISSTVFAMDEYNVRNLKKETNLLVIVSTHGEGDPPLMAEDFYHHITGRRAPKLDGLKYSVLALGDKSYKHFCKTGIEIDRALAKAGAASLSPVVTCDVDFESDASLWMDRVLTALGNQQMQGASEENAAAFPSLSSAEYSRRHPFEAEILEKVRLTGSESDKEVYHLEISLEGSGLTYEPGDALGVLARNPMGLVRDILSELGLEGDTTLNTHVGEITLEEALRHHYEITVLTREVLQKYAEHTNHESLKSLIENEEKLDSWLYGHDLLDLIHDFPAPIKGEELIQLLRPLPPRLYSISSSQEAVGEEVHITVSKVQFHHKGRKRVGACSGFLAEEVEPGDQLLIYIEKNYSFRLPENGDPVIMIGAGTGIAPYRAFLQHRKTLGHNGNTWLFYGDRRFSSDFLYQTEWQKYLKEGVLEKIDLAFSRDSKEKQYVQHRLLQQQKNLFQWLKNGAYIYLCGDRRKMAKDVENTLTEIIRKQGGMTPEKAKDYLQQLKRQKRFRIDVY